MLFKEVHHLKILLFQIVLFQLVMAHFQNVHHYDCIIVKIECDNNFGSAEQRPPHSGFFNDTKIERK